METGPARIARKLGKTKNPYESTLFAFAGEGAGADAMGRKAVSLAMVFVHKYVLAAPDKQRRGGFVLGVLPRKSPASFNSKRKCLIFRGFPEVSRETVDNFVDIPGEPPPKP